MLEMIVWLAGSYGFYRYMMGKCRRAAREGHRNEIRYLREIRES